MSDKTFVVSHRNARSPLTITGKNLEDALKKESLDPTLWVEVEPSPPEPDISPED